MESMHKNRANWPIGQRVIFSSDGQLRFRCFFLALIKSLDDPPMFFALDRSVRIPQDGSCRSRVADGDTNREVPAVTPSSRSTAGSPGWRSEIAVKMRMGEACA